MKIGIYSGSFNPIHNMHLNIAKELVNKGYLDKVIFVPAGNKYNKKDLISFTDRINMINLAIKEYPYLEVDNYEEEKGSAYTYEVMDYYKELYSNDSVYLIIGADNYISLNTWKNYEYLIQNKMIVIRRNDIPIKENNNIIVADIESQDVSSTKIREAIKLNKKTNDISNEIYDYIIEHNLYRGDL